MFRNMYKMIIVGAIMLSMTGSCFAGTVSFKDISATFWAKNAISAMAERAIVKGYPDGTFKPSGTVTYGEFIKMALIADTGKDVGNSATGNWAMNYYNEAIANGYFTASDIESGKLSKAITRGDMALIISSILGDVTIDNYDAIRNSITDVTATTAHSSDITKAYACGILTGYKGGSFKPANTLTRAESATVIYRLVDESKRVLPVVEGTTLETADLLKLDTFTPGALGTEDAHITSTCKVISAKDAELEMIKGFNGSIGAFKSNLPGFIYLIKDGKIVALCETFPMADEEGNYIGLQSSIFRTDISKVDYIIAVPTDNESDADKIITVVKNPF